MARAGYFVMGLVSVAVLWCVWTGQSDAIKPSERSESAQDKTGGMGVANKPEICEETVFEGARTILCVIDPSEYDIALAYRGADGEVFGSVAKVVVALTANGRTPVLAMNAGMYHADMLPVGLYVENSAEISPLNEDDGFGNFFLKPNGVFFVDEGGRAKVLETEAYRSAEIMPAFATQSGPMLVIDGALHPRFLPDGTSKYIRNGVGVRADGRVVLAITRDPLSLGSFGRLFRDIADCPNALFFDGAVSSLAWGTHMEIDAGEPAGPVVVVFGKSED